MKKIISICVAAIVIMSCNNKSNTTKETIADNQLTEQEKKEGWQLLFDGTSAKGWHQYGNKPIGSAWKVADGTIYLDTTDKKNGQWQTASGGDIVSDSAFGNFDLKVEWKIAKDGNSGIIFYVHEDTTKYKYAWMTGPEMQVLDNDGHPDGKLIKHRAGDLYDLISSSKETVKKPGEWNQAEIKALNGKLDFYLNGENVVSTTMWDTTWTGMIARSKFKEFPGFGTYKKGHIMLQDHGNTVWYRNVKIKSL